MDSIGSCDWWRGAFIYQIYPRSFYDSNADGVGDLSGIVEKIPYIADLGADAIWLSPFFTSPMKDFGYDVADHKNVDPLFGTLSDFEGLLSAAHAVGVKVIIDQVLSHTSDQHAWFQGSRGCCTNDKADWFVWANPKEDGTPPNNWLSFFGGSAWTFDARREQYFLHNFLPSQPDLNFHSREVQDAVLDVLKFWLDLGVDGFRFDTVNMYFCDDLLRDNPSRVRNHPIVGMNASNPRSYQAQKYNVNRPENTLFLKKIRDLLDQYDSITSVGEIGSAEDALAVMAEYTKGDARLHMCYTADLLGKEYSAQFIRSVIEATTEKLSDGWPCWSLGNHDTERFPSRWGKDVDDIEAFSKVMLATLFSLRGSFCLYQGEELGLPEADLPFDRLVDPFGIAFWPDYKGRDGCRTPMVWSNATHGGFSESDKTWLPVPEEHSALAVDIQKEKPDSILNHFKQFQLFRRNYSALVQGDITFIGNSSQILAFERTLGEEKIVVALNLSGKPAQITYLDAGDVAALEGHGFSGSMENDVISLPAWQAFFGRVV